MADECTTDIPIEEFRSDYHDPDEWLNRFESAVVLATNETDDTRKEELFLCWLPLKLDDTMRMLLSDCADDSWTALKAEFKDRLITPQDKYSWRAGRKRITWDGQESFHVLAARIKRTIDRYNDRARESDYYHEFRFALPRNYQQAIDLGHAAETLEEAKRIAFRCQAALACSDDGAGATGGKSAAFVGGAMSYDPLTSIERGFQEMSLRLDDLEAEMCGSRKEQNSCSRPSHHNPTDNISQENDFHRRGHRRDQVYEGHDDRDFDQRQDHFSSHGHRRSHAQEVTGQLHHQQRDHYSHSPRQYDANQEYRSDRQRHEDHHDRQWSHGQSSNAEHSNPCEDEEHDSQDYDFQRRGRRRDHLYEGHNERDFGPPHDHFHSYGHRSGPAQEMTGQPHNWHHHRHSHSRRHDNHDYEFGDNHY